MVIVDEVLPATFIYENNLGLKFDDNAADHAEWHADAFNLNRK